MAARNTIIVSKSTDSEADEPTITDKRYAASIIFCLYVAVFQHTLFPSRLWVYLRKTGDVVIIRIALQAIHVEREVSKAGIQPTGSQLIIGYGVVVETKVTFDPFGHVVENTIVHHIDDPTTCTT